jgi:hypothetical protein
MNAHELLEYLIDLHMQGHSLEGIRVSYRTHGDSDVEAVTHIEEGLQDGDGVPTEVMLMAFPLSTSPESEFQHWFDSI